jgi:hypothetical protein
MSLVRLQGQNRTLHTSGFTETADLPCARLRIGTRSNDTTKDSLSPWQCHTHFRFTSIAVNQVLHRALTVASAIISRSIHSVFSSGNSSSNSGMPLPHRRFGSTGPPVDPAAAGSTVYLAFRTSLAARMCCCRRPFAIQSLSIDTNLT